MTATFVSRISSNCNNFFAEVSSKYEEKIFKNPEVLDKVCKIGKDIFGYQSRQEGSAAYNGVFSKFFGRFTVLTGFLGSFEKFSSLLQGKFKNSPIKGLSIGLFSVANTIEGLDYFQRKGVLELGPLAKAIGGSRLYEVVTKSLLDVVAKPIAFSATVLSMIVAVRNLNKNSSEGKKLDIRTCVGVAGDTAKITLMLTSAYWFTGLFALLSITNSVIGIAKALIPKGN